MPATRKPDPDNAGGGTAVNSKTNPSSQQRRDFLLRAVIFANGELNNLEEAAKLIHIDDLLIAADGGASHCWALDLLPQFLVGDMDSIEPEEIAYLEENGVEIRRHPTRKDQTDLEIAFHLAQERGAAEILVLGGLGDRWDHSIANLTLAAFKPFEALSITYWEAGEWFYLVRDQRVLHGQPGQTVSLIPLGGDVRGITTTGLEYPLKNENLSIGSSRGMSNVMAGERAEIRIQSGLLLCIIGKKESEDENE